MAGLNKIVNGQVNQLQQAYPCNCYSCECTGSDLAEFAHYTAEFGRLGRQLLALQS